MNFLLLLFATLTLYLARATNSGQDEESTFQQTNSRFIRHNLTPRNLTTQETLDVLLRNTFLKNLSELTKNYTRLKFNPKSRVELKDCLQKSMAYEQSGDAAKLLGINFLFGFPEESVDGEEAQCVVTPAASEPNNTNTTTTTTTFNQEEDTEESESSPPKKNKQLTNKQSLENIQQRDPIDYFDVNITRAVLYLHQAELFGDADAPIYLLFIIKMGLLFENYQIDYIQHKHDLKGVMLDLLNAGIRRQSTIAYMMAFNEIRKCNQLEEHKELTLQLREHLTNQIQRGEQNDLLLGREWVLDFMDTHGHDLDGICLTCEVNLGYGVVPAMNAINVLAKHVVEDEQYVQDFESQEQELLTTSPDEKNIITDVLRARVEEGDAESMFTLAQLYIQGNEPYGIPQDYARAYDYFEQAAALQEPTALYNAGLLQMRGIGVAVNTSEAIKKIEKAAELGETEAIVYLGELYLEGIGVEQNLTRGIEYLRLGEKKNSTSAILKMAQIYEMGLEDLIQQDIKRAISRYKRITDKNILARYKLAHLQQLGYQTNISCEILQDYLSDTISLDHQELLTAQKYFREKQYERAFAYAMFSAMLGIKDSLLNAIYLLNKSTSVKCLSSNDRQLCFLLLRYLYALSEPEQRGEQFFQVGKIFYKGTSSIESQKNLTLQLWQLAAEKHPEAHYNLAYMYEHGEGLPTANLSHAKYLSDLLISKSFNGDFAIENIYVGLLNKIKLQFKQYFS